MSAAANYCLPLTEVCRPMADWGIYVQGAGTLAAIVFGIAGLFKIIKELERLNEQRKKEVDDKEVSARLKRTEFFLNQHRRLFDDPVLSEILCLIDDDAEELANPDMADKKRKFITFFEEIALLVKSKQINENVAYYMFGYYATCVVGAKNFQVDIDSSPEHWGLLYEFVSNAKAYFKKHKDGPPIDMGL